MSATPACMCQVCEMSHQIIAKGLISRSLGVWSCRRKRMQFTWSTWNFQRTMPEFLLLDDVDLSVHSRTLTMRAEERHGTGSFDVCTRNGAYSHCIQHGLPTVMLTNEYTTWCSFQSHGYFRNHVTSSSPVQRWDLKYLEMFVHY